MASNKSTKAIAVLVAIIITMMTTASLALLTNNNGAWAISSSSSNITTNTQSWTDPEQNLKIQFTYQPQKPVIDQPTELKFTVQNLNTGQYLKNLVANVLVTDNASGQYRNYKFDNIVVPNGQFSVHYLFPDVGLYEVVTRISAKDIAALAPFKVVVPMQPIPP
ncbi:MAG: hypothetical protein JO297_11440 [Nitrososphaeraceae archaeon]|nr:hypothetical protein [Nitrososphaeraceae archaeon]